MTILILDGHNLLFRSFTTLPRSIATWDGEPINGVYGLLGTIIRLIREYQASRVIATFDVPETPTFRHELYPPYQAQRGPLGGEHAENFRLQIELARRILPALDIMALTHPGYEADDIMGSVASRIADGPGIALLVSTDRDLLQLVRSRVEILVPGPTPLRLRDDEAVKARLGVPPSGVTTFKALCGDPSDNIPGVAGIGAKTAIRLVNEYETLETIYENLATLPPRAALALAAGKERAFLFRRLVTVVTDLDLGIDLDNLPRPQVAADNKPRQLLDQLGYGTPGGIRTPDL